MNGFREATQRYLLRTFAAKGFFHELAFVGGTALRIGHQLNRFSEDLDFAVRQPMSDERVVEFGELAFEALKKIKIGVSASRDFRRIPMGGEVDKLDYYCRLEVKLPSAFAQGASTFGLSLDLDRNPAPGWSTEPLLVKSSAHPFAVTMHDLPSLFAGKLHVLCCRMDRAKGRDFFDLAWYLSQGVEPNLVFLQATIDALEPKPWPVGQWAVKLIERLDSIDFKRLCRDLEPFLIDEADLMLMDRELLVHALHELRS